MRTTEHPSDRLLHGPVAGFEEALELVEAEWAQEAAYASRGGIDLAVLSEMEDAHAQINAATRHAGRVYREELERARWRTALRLREDVQAAEAALDDTAAEWLGLLADALERQDYRQLAI